MGVAGLWRLEDLLFASMLLVPFSGGGRLFAGEVEVDDEEKEE